jgi:hypothetical protein
MEVVVVETAACILVSQFVWAVLEDLKFVKSMALKAVKWKTAVSICAARAARWSKNIDKLRQAWV